MSTAPQFIPQAFDHQLCPSSGISVIRDNQNPHFKQALIETEPTLEYGGQRSCCCISIGIPGAMCFPPRNPLEPVIDFSIVIPTYNRPQALQHCLQALCNLDYRKDRYEVILIDDGGNRPLEALVAPFRTHIDLQLIRQNNAGPGQARNTGMKAARGQYIALTDDDCIPAKDWLSRAKASLDRIPGCAVAGKAENSLLQNPYSASSQLLVDYLAEYYNHDDSQKRFGTSNNLVFPRKALLQIGGFNDTFPLAAAEDRELIDRWIKQSNTLVYDTTVVVKHCHDLNFFSFFRQHANYGRGAYCYHSLRSGRNKEMPRFEPISFYLGMLTYPCKRGYGLLDGSATALLISISQLANAYGYFRERWLARGQHIKNA